MQSKFNILFILFIALSITSKAQLAVGDTALNFTLPDTNGTPISLQEYNGDVILLNFFASWCVPCSIEAPQLQDSIWSVYRNQNFTLIGVDFQEPLFPLLSFINYYDLTFPIVRDTAGQVFNDYGLIVLPTNVLINQNGVISWLEPGFDIPVMKSIIDSLLQITAVPEEEAKKLPREIELISNYPNPFNNQTNFALRLKIPGKVGLTVYDILGKTILKLEHKLSQGANTISLNMTGHTAGIYFYSITKGVDRINGKFLLYQ